MTAWHGGDDLILAVAAQNNNTIVVVHSVGPLILEPWIDHPNVTAVRVTFLEYSDVVLIFPIARFYGQAYLARKLAMRLRMCCMVIGIPQADCHIPSQRIRQTILRN